MQLCDRAIPDLAVYNVHCDDFDGGMIRLMRGGINAVANPLFATHTGLFTWTNGILYGTEETGGGLREDSLAEYTKPSDYIVSVYQWNGWNDAGKCEAAKKELFDIIAKHGASSRYNYPALLAEIPVVGRLFQWAWKSKAMICSQMAAWIHIQYGCTLFENDHLAPDQIDAKMSWACDNIHDSVQGVRRIKNFYFPSPLSK